MRIGEGPGPPGRAAGARAAPPALDRGVASALRRLPVLVDRLLPAGGPAVDGPSAGAQPGPLTPAAADELQEVLERLGGYLRAVRELGTLRLADAAAAAAVLKDSAAQSALLRVTALAVRRPLLTGNGGHSESNGGGASSCRSSGASASGSGGSDACSSPGSISSGSGGTCGTGASGVNSGIGDRGSNARSDGRGNGGCSSSGRGGGGSACGGSGGSGSKHGGFNETLAYEACSTICRMLALMTAQPPRSPAALDFANSLLRMQTLQCLARRFAEAAAAAEALTLEQLALTLTYSKLASCTVLEVTGLWGSATTGAERLTRASLVRQLVQALSDSSMLEHWARLLLLLLQRPSMAVAARDMTVRIFKTCRNLQLLNNDFKKQGGGATSAALRRLLSAPCVLHAVLVHGVAALCAADGGAAYGLPEGVWRVALGVCTEAAAQRGGGAPLQLPGALVHAVQAVLRNSDSLTPVGTRVAVHMLLRLGRLVVASSGGGWTVELRSILPPVQLAGRGVVVPRADVGPCIASILPPTLNLLRPLLVAGAPDWVAEAGADGWRLVAAAMSRSALLCAISSHRAWLGTHPLLDWVAQFLPGKPLPSATPPVVTAVLAGGLLPCLERLLRLAAEEPLGPESDVVAVLGCERACHLWILLLAYGEPRQAAALVATVGKLLRRAGAGAAGTWVSAVTTCASGTLLRSLRAATTRGQEAVDAATIRGQEAGPPEQLARLLFFALREWLPELARIALQRMAAPAATAIAQSAWAARTALDPLLAWLPLLLLRCGRDGGGATDGTATVGAADVTAGSSAACDAGGWLRLLLEDVHMLPLLGGALRLPLPVHGDAGNFTCLAVAQSCCLVAATWPAEVRQAACANAVGGDSASVGVAVDSTRAASAASPPPACPSAWPPGLLRALVPRLRESGSGLEADGVVALAELLEVWAAGGGGGGGGVQESQARERFLAAVSRMKEPGSPLHELASAFEPPAQAHELLRTCAYRGCTRLAGDSEAAARLQACGRCGAVWYCSRECQLSHWREGGHKEACAGAAKAAAAACAGVRVGAGVLGTAAVSGGRSSNHALSAP